MKTLTAVDNVSTRAKMAEAVGYLHLIPMEVGTVIDLMKGIPSHYELGAHELIGTLYKSDHLVDDTGVYHRDISFEIKEITRIGDSIWIFGDEYKANLSELIAVSIKIMEETAIQLSLKTNTT